MDIFDTLTPAQKQAIDTWYNDNIADNGEIEYQDNDRVARLDNLDELCLYEDARLKGCCGSVDVELDCADGTRIVYGFNYGH